VAEPQSRGEKKDEESGEERREVKCRRVTCTDLSDKSIQLCTQDAIAAVHRRALGLGLVDKETPRFSLLDGASLAGAAPPPAQPPPPGLFTAAAGVAASLCALVGPRRAEAPAQCGATAREGGPPRGTVRTAAPPASTVLSGPDAEAEAAEAEAEAVEASGVRGLESAVLDPATQRALYRVLHPHVTSIVHEAALRRHASAQACTLSDVLRLSELAGRIFLMVPLASRGAFATACRDCAEVARSCWSTSEYEQARPSSFKLLRCLGSPVAQLAAWVRSSQQHRPAFFLLALGRSGQLEQLRIGCRRRENDTDGETEPAGTTSSCVEQTKDWRLDTETLSVSPSRDSAALLGPSHFVVTKHHAYCIAAVHGNALLVKLGGQASGTHEAAYRDRFPQEVTAMAMCPHDNNIIAFGTPRRAAPPAPPAPNSPAELDAAPAAAAAAADLAHAGATPPLCDGADGHGLLPGGGRSPGYGIDLINFASSSRLQSLPTAHACPLSALEYSPDSSLLLSCSSDALQLWDTRATVAAPAAVATHALRRPASLILSRVHPAWTSLLLATSEALEVRELRRSAAAATACGAPPLFGLKWRRDTLQVTAAAFLAQGNMLCVSDRGDGLLLLLPPLWGWGGVSSHTPLNR